MFEGDLVLALPALIEYRRHRHHPRLGPGHHHHQHQARDQGIEDCVCHVDSLDNVTYCSPDLISAGACSLPGESQQTVMRPVSASHGASVPHASPAQEKASPPNIELKILSSTFAHFTYPVVNRNVFQTLPACFLE